jgi:Protein of unknown function (DUF3034)
MRFPAPHVIGCMVALLAAPAFAEDTNSFDVFDEGKLLATGGVSTLEGSGGGGLATWAMISGYGTRDGVGLNAHYTYVGLPDYHLQTPGLAIDLFDRVELSYAYQSFDTQKTGAALGLGEEFTFHQNIVGAKVKLFGDAIYDQDDLWPQIAVGLQYKSNDRGTVIQAVGGQSSTGVDYYLSATKVFLAESLLLDGTLRLTKANQFGILGFGGDKHHDYSAQFEGSAAYLVSREFAVGADFRTKPNNLSIANEDNAFDIFAAWFISKNLSVTLAYADIGNVVIHDNQNGVYVSLQAGL